MKEEEEEEGEVVAANVVVPVEEEKGVMAAGGVQECDEGQQEDRGDGQEEDKTEKEETTEGEDGDVMERMYEAMTRNVKEMVKVIEEREKMRWDPLAVEEESTTTSGGGGVQASEEAVGAAPKEEHVGDAPPAVLLDQFVMANASGCEDDFCTGFGLVQDVQQMAAQEDTCSKG